MVVDDRASREGADKVDAAVVITVRALGGWSSLVALRPGVGTLDKLFPGVHLVLTRTPRSGSRKRAVAAYDQVVRHHNTPKKTTPAARKK